MTLILLCRASEDDSVCLCLLPAGGGVGVFTSEGGNESEVSFENCTWSGNYAWNAGALLPVI